MAYEEEIQAALGKDFSAEGKYAVCSPGHELPKRHRTVGTLKNGLVIVDLQSSAPGPAAAPAAAPSKASGSGYTASSSKKTAALVEED